MAGVSFSWPKRRFTLVLKHIFSCVVSIRVQMIAEIFLFIGAASKLLVLNVLIPRLCCNVNPASFLVFSAQRIYAIYGCNRWIFFMTLLLCLGNPAISLVSLHSVRLTIPSNSSIVQLCRFALE